MSQVGKLDGSVAFIDYVFFSFRGEVYYISPHLFLFTSIFMIRLLAFAMLFVVTCICHAEKCIIWGSIGSQGTVYLLPYCYLYDVTIFPHTPIDSVTTNIDGHFRFVLEVPPNSVRAIQFSTVKFFLCLAPDDSVELNYDSNIRYFNIGFDKTGSNKKYYSSILWKETVLLQSRLDAIKTTVKEFSTWCKSLPAVPLFDKKHSLLRDILLTDSMVRVRKIMKNSADQFLDADYSLRRPDDQRLWDNVPYEALRLTSFIDYLYTEVRRGVKIRFPLALNNGNEDALRGIKKEFQVAKTYTGIIRDNALFQVLFYSLYFNTSNEAMELYENEFREFQRAYTDINILTAFSARLNASRKFIGSPAPNFKLKDKTGKMHLLSDYEDKVVCLEFTATWCGPCRELIPAFKELHKRMKNVKDVVFLRVWLEGPGYDDKWRKFLAGNTMHGIDLIALGGFIAPTALEYQVNGIPKIAVINRGKIETLTAPYPQKGNDDLEKLLLSLIENKAVKK